MADVTPVTLQTSDGVSLEAEMTLPESPRAAVVVTHPHPLMGGDMYTPVPSTFFRALPDLGCAGLRFNFRGVGRSTGSHDEGNAERLDVAAALDRLSLVAPNVPLAVAGWSFGADVSLGVDDVRIAGWFLAAAPLRVLDPETMPARHSDAPKVFAVGERDQFAPPDAVAPKLASWKNATVEIVDGADHFFGAQLGELRALFDAFVAGLVPDA